MKLAVVVVCAALFAGAAAATIAWSASMAGMGEMPMPGGWTMSMAWMRMPARTWAEAAASFVGMWIVMMVAMMMPALVPTLRRYRRGVAATSGSRLDRLTVVFGAGYFAVWTAFGVVAYAVGVALAAIAMKQPLVSRAVPIASGVVVAIAGALQFTGWKGRHLACCRCAPADARWLPASFGSAWRHGLRLGVHCGLCCLGLMAVLLVVGIMDLRAMALVTLAITIERLAARGEALARVIGAIVVAAGLFLLAQAVVPA